MSMRTKQSSDVIEIENQYYVRAQSSIADNQTNVLMERDLFAVFDRNGDFRNVSATQQGLFYREMRHLSRLVLRLSDGALLLLSSSVRRDNVVFTADLTNSELQLPGENGLKRGALHFARSSLLRDNICSQRIHIQNYGREAAAFELTFEYQSDFADIFEVRGFKRDRCGKLLPPILGRNGVTLLYEGLDGIRRETRIRSSIVPSDVSPESMQIAVRLAPGEKTELSIDIQCRAEADSAEAASVEAAFCQSMPDGKGTTRRAELYGAGVSTSNEQFNNWIDRSKADLRMLVTETPQGLYPYAGVPWFSTIFGRDGIVTGLEYLWICPEVAKGVLSCLSFTQASETDPDRDAEPGKILHELRQSEMAHTAEVPFGRYYGSVDSTPLFVLLAAAYYKRTGDREFIESIRENIEKALNWIENYGDLDGDGFLEYGHSSRYGLLQQGWKDSQDSVFHSDGAAAEGPIALCEVQGYVYAAKTEIADVFECLGEEEKAATLRNDALRLKNSFHGAFWSEKISSYAIALDGKKRKCEVRSSNAGQLLFSGIGSPEHCQRMATMLESEIFFSGWGVRTIAEDEPCYNPMSYHNGSVWPHDNALIAFGLRSEKRKTLAGKILTGLFDASVFLDLHRMPELFCGFPRRTGNAPTLYPVACAPQAWAAGAVFLLLQACLGIEIDAPGAAIRLIHPMLPDCIPDVKISGITVGASEVSLTITGNRDTVSTSVLDRRGDIDVITVK
jgi:glycogen debranching enzyme